MSTTVLPLETIAQLDLPSSVSFNTIYQDLPSSVNFINSVGRIVKAIPGTATGVPPGGNSDLVNYTIIDAGSLLLAIQGSGNTDSTYVLSINGTNTFQWTTNIVVPNVDYKCTLNLNVGDNLILYVVNNSTSSGTYVGSITGEF